MRRIGKKFSRVENWRTKSDDRELASDDVQWGQSSKL